MTESIVVRQAQESDLPAMYRVSSRAHQHGYEHLLAPDDYQRFLHHHEQAAENEARYIVMMREHMRASRWTMYVAVKDEVVLGYTTGRTDGEHGYVIRGLFVDPRSQGAGIGHSLLTTILNDASDRLVIMKVLKSNERAINLYARFGFAECVANAGFYYNAPEIELHRRPLTSGAE